MLETLVGVAHASLEILFESAPFVLLGLAVAALMKALVPEKLILHHLGGRGAGSVVKAALAGIPLPLCSCGVLPAALGLRKSGASRGASVSFLIATPETGVDSIAISYVLLDPIMTVIRPLGALLTSITAGLLVDRLPPSSDPAANTSNDASGDACETGCCACGQTPPAKSESAIVKFRNGFRFAFVDLLGDIGPLLLLGFVIAGTVSWFMPDGFVQTHLRSEWMQLLVMLGAGIPLYVCATASTPIAAALALKGLSPGAALVFLLAGPATNAATLTVLTRIAGKRAALIYVGVIAAMSLLLGLAVNRLYHYFSIDTSGWLTTTVSHHHGVVDHMAALILVLLTMSGLWPRLRGFFSAKPKQKPGCCA